MFDRFFEMFRNISMGSLVIIVGIVIVIILVAILIARARAKRGPETPRNKRYGQNMPVSKIKAKSQAVNVTMPKMGMSTKGVDKWANAPLYVSDKDRKAMGEKAISEEATEEEPESLGDFPAYIVRMDGSLDYDIIHQPLGDVFTAEPSMPKSGACYFVKEKEGGGYEAYDPRTAPLVSDETPVKAWFATHWDIVRQVFSVPAPWYKSISLWIAAVTGVLAFIIVLATVGG